MPLHIANWKYADIGTAVAAEAMDQGSVCYVDANGVNRQLNLLGDSDDAQAVNGKLAVAMKVSSDPNEVDSSTAPARLGSRVPTIAAGDLVMEVRPGALIRYTADLLDDGLDPSTTAGTTPAIGDALGIKGSKWCAWADNAIGGTAAVAFARVHKVYGTDVVVELLAAGGSI